MKNIPKVSVLIPAYNSMAYLPETIARVLEQTYTDFEVIVVDDGSTDNLKEWITQISDPRVRLITQVNQGAAAARNTGINHARGEYIAFLDADDLWESTKLEQQVRILDGDRQIGVVYCWAALINEKGKPTGRIFKSYARGNVWESLTEENIIMCGSTAIVRRQCFQTCGVFDLNIKVAEDWDMWFRIAAAGYTFDFVAEPLVGYRQHPQNKSKSYTKKIEDFRLIIEKAFKSAPFELLHLRNKSYGRVNLVLAWKCIQSSDRDYKQAEYFLKQALKHYPQMRFTREYIRLSTAITIMRCFGSNGYRKFLNLAYVLRHRTVGLRNRQLTR